MPHAGADRRIRRAALLTLLLAGCAAAPTAERAPAPPPAPEPRMAAHPASPVTADQFLERDPGVPFEVTVEGTAQQSFLAKARCAYFEWVYGERTASGTWASFSVGYQSQEPVTLVAAGQSAELDPRRLRPHLAPAVEREFRPGDAAAPEPIKQYLSRGRAQAKAAEYCLEVGRTYQAVVHEDRYSLPPEGPGQEPRRGTRRVLWLSDRPFRDGKPDVDLTPAFRGWTY